MTAPARASGDLDVLHAPDRLRPCAAGRSLFRLDEDPSRMLVRSDLLGAVKAAGLTCLVEKPLGEHM